jgi:hypothetical protein
MRAAVLCAACDSRVGASRLEAAPLPAIRDAVWRRAALSRLGEALLVAPLASASAMQTAVLRAACGRLEAAVVLATPASAMRTAVFRVGISSSAGAARVLAPPAAPMGGAVRRAACLS